jgi:hypothetical protein
MTTIKENNPYIYSKNYLSYWIFGWAIIYIVIDWGFNKQHLQTVVPTFARSYIQLFLQNCNPTIALVLAVIVGIYLFVLLFYRIIIKEPSLVNMNLDKRWAGTGAEERNKVGKVILFLYFTVIVIKTIPIYFLRNAPVKPVSNIIALITVILIYYFYLAINGINMYDFYKKTNENSFNGNTPFVHQILQQIK